MRVVSLTVALYVFWILLSGQGDPFLLGAGAIAALAIALLGWVFDYADDEGHPIEFIPAGLVYWPWLIKEIAKSAIDVSRIILTPSLPITPRLIRITPTQKTAVGLVTFANSITLTPGTITVEIAERRLIVHALTA